jgi:hypothetical protein
MNWLPTLIAGHRARDWALPDDLVISFDARERIVAADAPANGTLPSTTSAAAKAMIDAAMAGKQLPGEDTLIDGRRSLDFTTAWMAARKEALRRLDELVERYDQTKLYAALQTALDETIETFRRDRDIANSGSRRWADLDTTAMSFHDAMTLLDDPAEVHQALRRVLGDDTRRYDAIRTAWRAMRPELTRQNYDVEMDPNAPLGEIRNAPEIIEWNPRHLHATWRLGMTHAFLADMIDRGAVFWVPDVYAQVQAHRAYYAQPAQPAVRRLVSPFAALDASKTAPPAA